MEVKREVALEMAVAALLKAAKHHKADLIQRLGGQVDEFGGGIQYKSAAHSVIADIAQRV